jgi:hypothetical protein
MRQEHLLLIFLAFFVGGVEERTTRVLPLMYTVEWKESYMMA